MKQQQFIMNKFIYILNRISFLLILLIISIYIGNAKKTTSIIIQPKSENCSKVMILFDENNNDRFDECFYFMTCGGFVSKYYTVIDNYYLKSGIGYYNGFLFSGSYEGPDFVYVITETASGKAVAKLYNNGADNLIIDPLPVPYNYNNNFNDNLDDYFYYLNQNGIITLTKKTDFLINKIFISDLSGRTIFTSDVDQSTYYLDLSNRANGEYFLNVITPDNYLLKKIILIK